MKSHFRFHSSEVLLFHMIYVYKTKFKSKIEQCNRLHNFFRKIILLGYFSYAEMMQPIVCIGKKK